MLMREVKTSLIKSNAGYSEVTTEGMLSSKRFLFLEGKIDSEMAMTFTKQFLDLSLKDRTAPINVIINSSGGEINAGQLIIDVLSDSETPVNLFCFEKAYSMAAVIFISSGCNRFMLPNSSLMIHQPSITDISGNCSEIHRISKELDKYKDKMYQLIANHSDFSIQELKEKTLEDLYLTAEESVERHLADEVTTFSKMVAF